ncbi:prespore-specific regulator [Bacillus tianshenii]|uniref:Prespore-specific regulator n=1 Tax=Sutcliffiella tianshenii TaxID=1463404 RepID=A0ABS2P0J7_9BACI|nr:RsfA family transcriptional regulator [Bacillus tianshenii]MBM7620404.1 prespore-specific regulator [Bacillus tianshenii]
MKVRQDAWSHEDDLLLAETVLRYIRDGGTQLAAFEEVGDKLNRTSAACGFRWNAEVRKKYEPAVAIAKKQRKERKRALDKLKKQEFSEGKSAAKTMPAVEMEWLPAPSGTTAQWSIPASFQSQLQEVEETDAYQPLPSNQGITLDDCIHFMQNLKREKEFGQGSQLEHERLKHENHLLKRRIAALEDQLHKLEEKQSVINDDYEMLVQIMDRAKKMTALQNEVM